MKCKQRLLPLSLAALLAYGAVTGTSLAFSSDQEAEKTMTFSANAYAYGPGVDNLSSSDEYARYQWGLRNDGDLEYVEVINRFQNISPTLAYLIDFANWAGYEIPEEYSGPDSYRQRSIRAVKGADINIQPAWQQYDSDTGEHRTVTVAVIDTGIDITHPELEGAIWTNEDEIPDDGIDNDGNGYIDDVHGWNFFSDTNQIYVGSEDSHGTHAAGTIAAKRSDGGIAGIADPKYVKIMSLKVLGTENGYGEEEAVLNAIRYAEANGASICNISFGTEYYYPALEELMRNSNMLFILSAGNGDSNGNGMNVDTSEQKDYPACFHLDNTISVANLMFNGSLENSSNYGVGTIDIAAPGTYILGLAAGNGYGYMTGTSMSAPMVTGVAAMIYSCRTDFSLADVREAILNTARKWDTLTDKLATGGVVDAYAALNYQKAE
ncbi:MAG: S8 family serine peptidase [Clostridiales bacterium]|nr:S8 family serine peptidase [Clostridiales bacterium]